MTTAWSSKAGRVRLHGLATRYAFYNQPLVTKRLADEAVRVGSGEMDLHEEEFAHTLYQALCATPFQRTEEVHTVGRIARMIDDVNTGDHIVDATFSSLTMSDIAKSREHQPCLCVCRGIYKVECPSFDPEDFAATGRFRCYIAVWSGGKYAPLGYANYERVGFTFRQESKLIPAKDWLLIQKGMTAAIDSCACANCGTTGPHNNGGGSVSGTCRICNHVLDRAAESRVYRAESESGAVRLYTTIDELLSDHNMPKEDVFRVKRLSVLWNPSTVIHPGTLRQRRAFTITRFDNIHDAESNKRDSLSFSPHNS